MSRFRFTDEHWAGLPASHFYFQFTMVANNALDNYLSSCEKVRGYKSACGEEWFWGNVKDPNNDTHTAYLFDVERLLSPACASGRHTPGPVDEGSIMYRCTDCKCPMRIVFEEIK